MSRKKTLYTILFLACFAVLMLCSSVAALAESSIRITKPANGSTIKPGNVEIWAAVETLDGMSGSQMAAAYTPISLKIYKESTLISEPRITPGSVYASAEGGKIGSVALNEEGTYTIKASVPKTSSEWHSVTFKVSNRTTSEGEDDGPTYSISNPGHFINPEKDTYNAKVGDTVTIKFSMSVNASATGSNKFLYYSDHLPESSQGILKFKGLSEYKWTEKDGKLVTEGIVEYTCLKNGTGKLYVYVLVNAVRYDKHVITINVGNTSGSTSASAAGTSGAASSVKTDLPKVKPTSVKAAKKSMTVKWKKLTKANLKKIKKIEIQYSQDKKFESDVQSKFVNAKKTSCKIKGLTSKKKYYVRIRAYTQSGSELHVSRWSGRKAAKVK